MPRVRQIVLQLGLIEVLEAPKDLSETNIDVLHIMCPLKEDLVLHETIDEKKLTSYNRSGI